MNNIDLNKIKEVSSLKNREELLWFNTNHQSFDDIKDTLSFLGSEVWDASYRFKRFQPLIAKLFPEIENGIIESALVDLDDFQNTLSNNFRVSGKLLLKCDNSLPISHSVKSRGGIYEVLCYAESLALNLGLISTDSNYQIFADFYKIFANYTISVGSTGNLGLSIALIARKLGFNVIVHMSQEAKQWKKSLLKKIGAKVIEHSGDYTFAVECARTEAKSSKKTYFVDDENSKYLFLGYAAAALHLKEQLSQKNIKIDSKNPLFVYLPCGVGGSAGGITFGLKQVFQDNVHCFFAEPVDSPAMTLGLLTQLYDKVSIQDIGLHNNTIADGLVCSRPSRLSSQLVNKLVNGCYTASDGKILAHLQKLYHSCRLKLEPSAAISLEGYIRLLNSLEGQDYMKTKVGARTEDTTHICWATGGNLIPQKQFEMYL